jgi:uncharacterized MAPEG superfamily protein
MPMEMQLLVWSTALAFAQMLIASSGTTMSVGLITAVGNRQDLPDLGGWAGRAHRAHRNLLENLLPFAILVLAAHALGKSNAMTVLGAKLFFWARVAYAAVYIAGIPWLRTAVYAVSVAGLAILFLQLV